jgi:signal transduction histidine kinase
MSNIILNNPKGETDIDKLNKYLSIMKQNSYRLIKLINNLIDISKIDAGYYKINLCNCNIVSVVEEITMSVAEYIQDKGMKLIFDTDTEEKIIACDPEKIERIILNLLSNAVKFTDAGGSIYVSVNAGTDKVKVSVRDTGICIPGEKLEKIFERFVQVDKSLSRNHEGSGIGLSLVKSLVEMHGGNIKAFSKIGLGSEFVFELPAEKLINEEEYEFINCTDTTNIKKALKPKL